MSIISNRIFLIQHSHISWSAAQVQNLLNIPLNNPLYRSPIEKVLSYFPLLSTITGMRALQGITELENLITIRMGNFSKKCRTKPCVLIHREIPKIRFNAWLEVFGIKAIYYLIQGIIKIVRILIRFCSECFHGKKDTPLPTPLSPQPVPMQLKTPQQEIDEVYG
ncbi:hypothetical protein [Candidatus Chlamydia sanziniae]|uniref:Uncharacterized protein n=1 Tax=Candidatus Chlamydia sanziniae TaxID=1806891 RepID=A0A1A9HXS8_9CHLA|nr:hypothetical protein [Candidatus Chlamydia sanziniae]ANH78892.1 hypothetical protein Cs308_0722 [Candidatus Chlamydia sanziniae]